MFPNLSKPSSDWFIFYRQICEQCRPPFFVREYDSKHVQQVLYSIQNLFSVVLQVVHKRVPCRMQEQSLFLTAVENTWIHGRQRKREQKRQLRELPRAPHCAAPSSQTTSATAPPPQTQPPAAQNTQDDDDTHNQTSNQEPSDQQRSEESERNGSTSHNRSEKDASEKNPGEDLDMESPVCTAPTSDPTEPPPKRPLSPVEHFLFKCLLNVMLEEGDVLIEMHWVEGHNKDLMNQLCTYLKNTLLKSVTKS